MKAAKKDIKLEESNADYEMRETQWGEMNVGWETFNKKLDATEMFKGLPDNMCQASHWGYVLKGKMTINYKDHKEIVNAGDVYYMAPGHIPIMEAGTEVVEFSPIKEYQKTLEAIAKNM
jgi:mannose-6-phosphate isomerase-like protein (cupin superfamily)